MHVELGGYHVRDVEVVAAFDVDGKKVGTDVAEAIFTEPNNTIRFAEDVPPLGVTVSRGRTLDGLGAFYREVITESDAEADVVRRPARRRTSSSRTGRFRGGREVLRAVRDRRRRGLRELPAGVHRLRPRWARKFGEAGFRSSATTSSRRSARRSPIGCSRSCSRTAAPSSTARTSSTSAATWTS